MQCLCAFNIILVSSKCLCALGFMTDISDNSLFGLGFCCHVMPKCI
jgi:hypothetical protein